jgi:predicted component of type VI protein secretion system
MQINDATNLVTSVAALMERFERRTQQIEDDLRSSHYHLTQLTQQVPGVVRQATDAEMQRLPGAVMGKIEAGIQQPVSAYEQRLQSASQQLQQGAQALSAQITAMQALHRHLIWKVGGITLGSLVLVLVGGGWLSKHYYDEIRRNQLSAELLKAYNAADVTLCGGKLCANVDAKGDKFGNEGQYRSVRDRP